MDKEQAEKHNGVNEKNKEDQGIKAKNPKKNKVKMVRTKGEMFQGTLNPISIFPEEIWAMILALVSTLDRLAICRTNSQLDTAFGKFKNEWLLDQVLPFLLKHFTHKSHLLKCRQVCKTWRCTVNSFLESEHPCRRFYQKYHPLEQVFCRMPTIYSSLRHCGLEHVQFTPDSTHKFSSCPDPCSPLVGRAVSFRINFLCSDSELEAFWIQARTFLELQGGNIWHFKFAYNKINLDIKRMYLILRESLSLLPNLRTLEIWVCHVFSHRGLVDLIASNPLPILPNLHYLDIMAVPEVMQEHFIVQFNSQLKRLSLHTDLDFYECNLPENLVELFVKWISYEQLLLKFYTIPKSCRNLTLDINLHEQVFGHHLLRLLIRYPRLSHFQLILQTRTSFECESLKSTSEEAPVIPGVEYFEIEGDGRSLFYFSSLVYKFPNLKYLHIRDTSDPGHGGNQQVRKYVSSDAANVEIQQYLYSRKLEESPIWDTLGKLEVLTFENVKGSFRRFCNREQVKFYRNRMGKQDKKSM